MGYVPIFRETKGARLGRLEIRRGEHQVSPGVASAPVAPGVHIASVGYELLPDGVVSSTSLCGSRHAIGGGCGRTRSV